MTAHAVDSGETAGRGEVRRRGVGRRAPRSLVALLSAWLGAGLLFAASVAPAAFAVLPSRTLAGEMVGRVLPVLFLSGLAVGVLLAVAARGSGLGRSARRTLLVGGAVMAVACAAAQFVVDPLIGGIRDTVGRPIDALPEGDPVRARFGMLHALSVGLLGVAWIGGAGMLVLAGLGPRERRSAPA